MRISTRASAAARSWPSGSGSTARRAIAPRRITSEIDEERWEVSTALCREIIRDGGYEGAEADHVASTLEGLYDGFCLNILIYPGEFTRDDAKRRIRGYLACTFPKHFQRPEGPGDKD